MFKAWAESRAWFAFACAVTLPGIGMLSGCGHGGSNSLLPPGVPAASRGTGRHTASLQTTLLSINVGGGATGSFVADIDGQGGTPTSVTDTIALPPANAAPAGVYQTQRFGPMTYTIPNLTPGTSYDVRLHFAETWFGLGGRPGAGQRLFNVAINGANVLSNFDVFAAAGAGDTGIERDFSATATAGGQITIALTNGSANYAILNGIEILSAAAASTAAINVSGPAIGAFSADVDGVGGTPSSTTDAIDVSAPNAAPMAVYQTQRYGPMTYTIPGFTAGGAYIVRLHFAELYWGADGHGGGAGSRTFNVAVNGNAALTNYDVYATAGGADRALVTDIPANADASGQFTIALTNGAHDNAMLNAIQILPATSAQSVNIGGPAVGNFAADTLPNGGSYGIISSSTATINVSTPNAAPQAVYQTQRYGPFTRTIGGLTPGSAYTFRLHFAELYFGLSGRPGVGQRMFNVALNGSTVLSNFDVFAAAGAANTAVVRDFPVTADASGSVTVAVTNGAADNAMLSAIEIVGANAPPPVFASETPGSSDAFVDSVGVNVHLSEYGTLYGNNFGAVQSLLAGAGIRHIRDGVTANNSTICGEDQTLAASGVHVDVISVWSMTDMASWLGCIGPAAESIEGVNEWDLSNDPNWVADIIGDEQTLAVQFPQIPLLAPALTSEPAFLSVGSLANIVSFGNAHAYFAGRNPGTGGWGATDAYGTYGSLAWNLSVAGIVGGSKPIEITEGGYSDQLDQYAVPAVTKGRYTVRMLLNDWNGGAARTYIYELVDEGSPNFSHYGLVDASGNPKPAYSAVAALLGHLSDPGPAFTGSPLSYNFIASASVDHTLLQKRNGTYELVFWDEVSEWDPNANAPQATTPQAVQLAFPKAPTALTQSTFGDNGLLTSAPLTSASTVTLSAGPWPTIVDITP
jgi:hypothetical protein